MSNVQSNAGTVVSVVAGIPATEDQLGYEALTFTPIGEVVSMDGIGKNFNKIEHKAYGTRKVEKRKGSYDNGSPNMSLGKDLSDAGQVILKTASDDLTGTNYSFKVALEDGSVLYFYGEVFSFINDFGDVDTIIGATVNIEANSDIVEISA